MGLDYLVLKGKSHTVLTGIHIDWFPLTYWGQVTHICVGNLTIIGSDNGLSPYQCHAIVWTNAGILLIGPLGTNFSEFSIEILTFSFKKMHFKVSSGKWRPFCLNLNVLIIISEQQWTITFDWSQSRVTLNRKYPQHALSICWIAFV